MSNTFATAQTVARNALVELVDNLVLPQLAYRDFSDTYAVQQGDTIQVAKPPVYTAQEFNGTASAQDLTERTVAVKLDKLATVDVDIKAIEMATSVDDLNRLVTRPAAIALAEKINRDGLGVYPAFQYLGTAGTTPDGLDDFAAASKALIDAKAPMTDQFGVWDSAAYAEFIQIPALINAEKAGTTTALREGNIGKVFNINNYVSQGVAKHTAGATGTVLIDGAATAGATRIHVDGLTTAFKPGDCFTIASDSTKYHVVKAGALETADQDIDIFPALAKNAANDAAVTVGGGYTANLVFQRNAIAFVTRPLIAPKGVEAYTTSYNGVTLRAVRGYDMATKTEKFSLDVLYGYAAVYPELGVTYLG